jgi:hypothetical protein
MPRAASIALAALIQISTSSAVFADEIRINSGSLDVRTVGTIRLIGNRGFFFQTSVSPSAGIFAPGSCNFGLLTCAPGAVIPLTASWSGSDLTGTAFLDANTYVVGGPNSPNQMAIAFSGSVTLPPLAASATVSAVFSFTGSFAHSTGGVGTAIETLRGTGIATLLLSASNGLPGTWQVDRVLYEFASPVLPPWSTGDIGFVGTSGSAASPGGDFIVEGSGADIWGPADAFRYVYQPISGDGEIIARVAAIQPTDPFAKAGVMFRSGLDPSSAHVLLNVKPDGWIEFLTRYASGETTAYLGGAASEIPVWLKLTRSGNTFNASYSSDGVTWIALGSVDLPSPPVDLFAGLAVTSHDTAVVNTSVFDHVSVTTPVPTHNLLQGGTFEEYVPPAFDAPGWVSDHLFRQTPAKSETHQPHTGAKNGACWTPEFLDCGIYQDVAAPVTGGYTFRVYATSDREGGLVGVNVNGVLAGFQQVTASGFGQYVRYSVAFNAQSGDVIRVWMYSPATPGYVVIDDAALTLNEAIKITDGTWEIGRVGAPPLARFTLNGNEVRITGSYDGGMVEAQNACSSPHPCQPGQIVSLRSTFENPFPQTDVSFARASATLGPRVYPFVELGGLLTLAGDAVTLPEPSGLGPGELVQVSAPFTFFGDLKGFAVLGRRDPDLEFDLPLVGHGTVTLQLLTGPGSTGLVLEFNRLIYVFE